MEVKVCKNCRRLFKYMFGPELCPECSRVVWENKQGSAMTNTVPDVKPRILEDEEEFDTIKEYVMTHPGATIAQISEEYGVTPSKILDWIREERLEFSEESGDAWFTCERCGVRIRSGRFCVRCKIK